MSGFEIERKFLVKRGGAYKRAAFACSHITQGYMRCSDATVRVRRRDDKAFLTIKSRSQDGGLSRYEFETEISLEEAEHLFRLCRGGFIDKHRYLVKSGRHVFEVDEFHGENEDLLRSPTSSAMRLLATAVSIILICSTIPFPLGVMP